MNFRYGPWNILCNHPSDLRQFLSILIHIFSSSVEINNTLDEIDVSIWSNDKNR